MVAATLALLAVLTLPVARHDPTPPQGIVRGRVVDGVSDRPLPAATVRLGDAARRQVVTTGADGSFAFADLPAGSYELTIARAAYESTSLTVVLPGGREVVVDVALDRRPSPLERVVVQAALPPPSVDSSLGAVRHREESRGSGRFGLRSRGMGALSALAAIQSRQSAQDPGGGQPPRSLVLWGWGTEHGRVLLDGAALNAPLHLGGLLAPVDSELVSAARLRTGGAPPRFDGGSSYVLELTTRDPAPTGPEAAGGVGELRTWGELDMLTGRLGAQIPLGIGAGVTASARQVNTDMVTRLAGTSFGYRYRDALARAHVPVGAGDLRATLFTTSEAVRLPRDLGQDVASWENLAGALIWGDGLTTAQLSSSSAVADLPLLTVTGGHLRGEVVRTAASVERRWERLTSRGGFGVEVERARFTRGTRVTPNGFPGTLRPFTDPVVPIAELGAARTDPCATLGTCVDAGATTTGLFGDYALDLSPRAHVSAGLRLNRYGVDAARPGTGGFADVLPRLALEGELGARVTARLSVGRYSQLGAVAWDSARTDAFALAGDAPPPVVVGHATQFELAVARHDDHTAFTATVFARRHDALRFVSPSFVASGVDLSYGYTRGALRGFAEYQATVYPMDSLARALDPARVPTARVEHVFSAGVEGTVRKVRLEMAAEYARGVPYTSIALDRTSRTFPVGIDAHVPSSATDAGGYAPSAAGSSRSYVRLDATASRIFQLDFGGRAVTLVPYLRVVNALNRRDALFFYRGADGRTEPLAALPALATVGIRWDGTLWRR